MLLAAAAAASSSELPKIVPPWLSAESTSRSSSSSTDIAARGHLDPAPVLSAGFGAGFGNPYKANMSADEPLCFPLTRRVGDSTNKSFFGLAGLGLIANDDAEPRGDEVLLAGLALGPCSSLILWTIRKVAGSNLFPLVVL